MSAEPRRNEVVPVVPGQCAVCGGAAIEGTTCPYSACPFHDRLTIGSAYASVLNRTARSRAAVAAGEPSAT